jgi:hypothetical protein
MDRTCTMAAVGTVVEYKTGDVESLDDVRLVSKMNDSH